MEYADQFRNKELIRKTVERIHALSTRPVTFMEVCGGHTMAIHKSGISSLLPKHIQLISGPGCPVCVTDRTFIDTAVSIACMPDIILTSFGDLMRVPGSNSTLNEEKAKGADIRVVYSPLDALRLALENPLKNIVFLAIGFETTAPGTAISIIEAQQMNRCNFMVLSAHKIMPPAMTAIIQTGLPINGYLAPGHVCTITGADIFRFIPDQYQIPVVVAGFEPLDILQSILLLVRQVEHKEANLEIQYQRVVNYTGNSIAKKVLKKVFNLTESWWRGLGELPQSGLGIKQEYKVHDAKERLPIVVPQATEPKGCICGDILRGLKKSTDCPLFRMVCTPDNPVGACMVSNEGACQASFRYNGLVS